ncbi:MAG: UDP-N-acetylglucosamine--N-acetylmuramyl-(pentapeptide) pyrophosphoryl-undecaprenol N-acetylglucosamine transferase [Planctomycetaceae bacterium]|nr:MAG: UDP-N-acetylglucosamine--N-acetylmuramyl-(pentapeptide) pyrophosphoryl-undecaprenol N-acetylglucosamine transferase [Planctomycetaceae bacterium]
MTQMSCEAKSLLGRRASHVLIAAGGSGGHLTPALAMWEAWHRRSPTTRFTWITTHQPQDKQWLVGVEDAVHGLAFMPPSSWRQHPWKAWRSYQEARRQVRHVLHEDPPDVVVTFGGWPTLPVLAEARRMRLPIVLCEQNVIPGRVNRWYASSARLIFTTYERTRRWFPRSVPVFSVGNPVRSSFTSLGNKPMWEKVSEESRITATLSDGCDMFQPGIDGTPPRVCCKRLLVLGGSQGSRTLNAAVFSLLARSPGLWEGWEIWHQTGWGDAVSMQEAYRKLPIRVHVLPFLSPICSFLLTADFVISRAGGTTLAELACAGVPAILVPWRGARDNHQLYNAREYAHGGAAILVEEGDQLQDTVRRLLAAVLRLKNDVQLQRNIRLRLREYARPSAADDLVRLLCHQLQLPQTEITDEHPGRTAWALPT